MQLAPSIAAVVTGGASGLGAATARCLVAQGVKVALFDLNSESGEALAREIGGTFCKVDVTSDQEVDAGFRRARQAHGQERILVNCAGTANAFKTASIDKGTGQSKHFPLADFERELIIERTLVGQAKARAAGTHMGRPSKTTDVQRQTIRARLSSGQTVSAVARDFKLSRATVMTIRDSPQAK